jgi:hypothetical protein
LLQPCRSFASSEQISHLRKKLDEYFATEGNREPVQIWRNAMSIGALDVRITD